MFVRNVVRVGNVPVTSSVTRLHFVIDCQEIPRGKKGVKPWQVTETWHENFYYFLLFLFVCFLFPGGEVVKWSCYDEDWRRIRANTRTRERISFVLRKIVSGPET